MNYIWLSEAIRIRISALQCGSGSNTELVFHFLDDLIKGKIILNLCSTCTTFDIEPHLTCWSNQNQKQCSSGSNSELQKASANQFPFHHFAFLSCRTNAISNIYFIFILVPESRKKKLIFLERYIFILEAVWKWRSIFCNVFLNLIVLLAREKVCKKKIYPRTLHSAQANTHFRPFCQTSGAKCTNILSKDITMCENIQPDQKLN